MAIYLDRASILRLHAGKRLVHDVSWSFMCDHLLAQVGLCETSMKQCEL